MTNFQFNEEQDLSRTASTSKTPGLVRLVINSGLAETEKGANYILLGIAIAGILFTLFSFLSGAGGRGKPVPPPFRAASSASTPLP